MVEAEVYQFYNDYVKTSYSEIEAKGNALPVELLFEINSAFDHLKRFHLGEEDELLSCEKAYSHLKRGLLDVFKLKLKYFNNDCSKLLGKKADLRIIDSGIFLPRLLEDKKRIVCKATEARLHEGKKELEAAFDAWYEVSRLINQFEEEYLDSAKVDWACKQSFFRFSANFLLGVLTGIVSSVIVALFLH
ncbi:MAG: hypothetical protein HDR33_10205 [Treponema sp.]|nr:hypothetical protein [Treponema sp.]